MDAFASGITVFSTTGVPIPTGFVKVGSAGAIIGSVTLGSGAVGSPET
jgi:hypothetical protein